MRTLTAGRARGSERRVGWTREAIAIAGPIGAFGFGVRAVANIRGSAIQRAERRADDHAREPRQLAHPQGHGEALIPILQDPGGVHACCEPRAIA
jgi:hypothetical protein